MLASAAVNARLHKRIPPMTAAATPIRVCMLAGSISFLVLASLHAEPVGRTRAGEHNEYPGKHWTLVTTPESRGWSSQALSVAKGYADSIDTAAVMVVDDGVVVSQWGATTTKFNVHSVRKSFLSS